MSLPKRKFRELILQLLYSQDFYLGEEEDVLEFAMEMIKTSKRKAKEAYEYAKKIYEKRAFLDEKIKDLSKGYELERISFVEKNILRLSIFELFFEKEIPVKVIFAEGVRLCRKFATAESSCFVNALLDALHKKEETAFLR
jgi:transcription antitermination protein NusB